MKQLAKWISVVAVSCLISACWQRDDLAPVVQSAWLGQRTHVVTRGETLYAIAFRYDKDYRTLAALNHLPPPYMVRVGQTIQLGWAVNPFNYRTKTSPKPRVIPPTRKTAPALTLPKRHGTWLWPAQGRLAASFIPQQGKKGIDIAGSKGQKIRAASSGVVAYSGSGLSGYGNLIIIRHDNQYLTAYGNNLRNFVKEGQRIKAGDIIADMGVIDRRYWGVHFEIRRWGQPVNPLSYLQ